MSSINEIHQIVFMLETEHKSEGINKNPLIISTDFKKRKRNGLAPER